MNQLQHIINIQMKNAKQILLKLPEYLLIIAVVFYWESTRTIINPLAIALTAILILQIIFKNRIVGFLLPCLIIVISLYMLMALMSEFYEFPTFNADAKELLFIGLSFFIFTITVSGIMIYKYTKSKS